MASPTSFSSKRITDLSGQSIKSIDTSEDILESTTIILDNNELSDFKALSSCRKLQKLSLVNNRILEIGELSCFTKLQVLNLSNNEIEKIEGLSKLVLLEWLNLSGNKIKVIDYLKSNIMLKHLDLSNNCISELGDLSNLVHLKSFLVRGNELKTLRDIPAHLAPSISTLSIDDNKLEDLTEMQLLGSLPFLENLSISGNPCLLGKDAGEYFDYRPYVICCCKNLVNLDGVTVTQANKHSARILDAEGHLKMLQPGEHSKLAKYLLEASPGYSTNGSKHPNRKPKENAKISSERVNTSLLESESVYLPVIYESPPKKRRSNISEFRPTTAPPHLDLRSVTWTDLFVADVNGNIPEHHGKFSIEKKITEIPSQSLSINHHPSKYGTSNEETIRPKTAPLTTAVNQASTQKEVGIENQTDARLQTEQRHLKESQKLSTAPLAQFSVDSTYASGVDTASISMTAEEALRLLNLAASMIQAYIRGFLQRKKYQKFLKKYKAAVKIQAAWRGYYTRNLDMELIILKKDHCTEKLANRVLAVEEELARIQAERQKDKLIIADIVQIMLQEVNAQREKINSLEQAKKSEEQYKKNVHGICVGLQTEICQLRSILKERSSSHASDSSGRQTPHSKGETVAHSSEVSEKLKSQDVLSDQTKTIPAHSTANISLESRIEVGERRIEVGEHRIEVGERHVTVEENYSIAKDARNSPLNKTFSIEDEQEFYSSANDDNRISYGNSAKCCEIDAAGARKDGDCSWVGQDGSENDRKGFMNDLGAYVNETGGAGKSENGSGNRRDGSWHIRSGSWDCHAGSENGSGTDRDISCDSSGNGRDSSGNSQDGSGDGRDGSGNVRDGFGNVRACSGNGSGNGRGSSRNGRDSAGNGRDSSGNGRDGSGNVRDCFGNFREGSGNGSGNGRGSSGNGRDSSGNGRDSSGNGRDGSGNVRDCFGNFREGSGNGSGNGRDSSGNGRESSGDGRDSSGNGRDASRNGQDASRNGQNGPRNGQDSAVSCSSNPNRQVCNETEDLPKEGESKFSYMTTNYNDVETETLQNLPTNIRDNSWKPKLIQNYLSSDAESNYEVFSKNSQNYDNDRHFGGSLKNELVTEAKNGVVSRGEVDLKCFSNSDSEAILSTCHSNNHHMPDWNLDFPVDGVFERRGENIKNFRKNVNDAGVELSNMQRNFEAAGNNANRNNEDIMPNDIGNFSSLVPARHINPTSENQTASDAVFGKTKQRLKEITDRRKTLFPSVSSTTTEYTENLSRSFTSAATNADASDADKDSGFRENTEKFARAPRKLFSSLSVYDPISDLCDGGMTNRDPEVAADEILAKGEPEQYQVEESHKYTTDPDLSNMNSVGKITGLVRVRSQSKTDTDMKCDNKLQPKDARSQKTYNPGETNPASVPNQESGGNDISGSGIDIVTKDSSHDTLCDHSYDSGSVASNARTSTPLKENNDHQPGNNGDLPASSRVQKKALLSPGRALHDVPDCLNSSPLILPQLQEQRKTNVSKTLPMFIDQSFDSENTSFNN